MSKEATLPALAEGQSWCCINGCGECQPRESKHEYFREEDMQGNLIQSKTEKIYVSHCCRAELWLWDEGKQDFVDWHYLEDAPATVSIITSQPTENEISLSLQAVRRN